MIGVIEQVKTAGKHPTAATVGALLGGFVPLATYVTAHAAPLGLTPATLLVLGGLLFSAKTVFQWGRAAFAGDPWKATGFVLLVEGVMIVAPQAWLGQAALGYLIAINAVATGCTLAQPAQRSKAVAKKLERRSTAVRPLRRVQA